MMFPYPSRLPARRTTLVVVCLAVGLCLSLGAEAMAADALQQARERRQKRAERRGAAAGQLEEGAERVDRTRTPRTTTEHDVARLQESAGHADRALAARAVLLYKRGEMGVLEQILTAG